MNKVSLLCFLAMMLAALLTIHMSCTEPVEYIDYSQFEKSPNINSKVDGFEVQTILKGEGEWLSMTSDPQGRLLISPRKGILKRISIDNPNGIAVEDSLDIGVYDCQGLLYAYKSLYMMGQSKDTVRGVYRLLDLDGQGNYGEPKLLMEFPRNGDHSGHTLAMGPDGLIYFLSGNDNVVPDTNIVSYVNSHFAVDHPMLLESFFGTRQLPPGGFVMRTDSIGSFWQLYAYGLRNPYDMCFSEDGELFTFDSDMEWDFNLPWYRPTRVNHLVSGGDYAWRMFNAKRFDHYPDIWPAVKDFGRGSPTATCFGSGTNFPEPYQDALFLGDWSYGRIYALQLSPNGSTFSGEYEVFADGKPLNITDMIVGPDGALYFVTGGNGTDTGLFRIVWNGKPNKPSKKKSSKKDLIALRKNLENYHFESDTVGLGIALRYVAHDDRFIRNAARVILERIPPRIWASNVMNETSNWGLINYLVGIVRTDSTNDLTTLISDQMLKMSFESLDKDLQLAYLRLNSLYVLRDSTISDFVQSRLQSAIEPHFPTGDAVIDKELSRNIVQLAIETGSHQGITSKCLIEIEKTEDPLMLLHYLEILRLVETGWSEKEALAFSHWIDYASYHFRGGSLFQFFLSEIRKDFQNSIPASLLATIETQDPGPLSQPYQGVFNKTKVQRTASSQSYEFVKNWAYEDLEYSLELVNSPRIESFRDWHRGFRMLEKGQCLNCHLMLDRGGSFGPEITLSGNSFNAGDLLKTMITPSEAINSRFQATTFELSNGESAVGRIMHESDTHYVIQLDWTGENTEEIPKGMVSNMSPSPVSEMPTGLLNSMGRDEILDLLYVISEIPSKMQDTFAFDIIEDQKYTQMGDSVFVEFVNYNGEGEMIYSLDQGNNKAFQSYEGPFYLSSPSVITAYKLVGENGNSITRNIHFYEEGVNGLNYKLYTSVDEAFGTRTKAPDQVGTCFGFDVRDIVQDMDNFEVEFSGFLQVDQPGEYTFFSKHNDAIKLYVNDQLIVDDAENAWDGKATAKIRLPRGMVPIKVVFFDRLAHEYLSLEYRYDGVSRMEIPSHKLFLKRSRAL